MYTKKNGRDLRILLTVAVVFGACEYQTPTVNNGSSSSSSSGGVGGAGGAAESSSSSSGKGGAGGSLVGGAGGLMVTGGAGGTGLITGSSSSSSSSGGGAGGEASAPTAIIESCGNTACNSTTDSPVCCVLKTGGAGTCNATAENCNSILEYALACDDKADCGPDKYCCLTALGNGAECADNCTNGTVCKVADDCMPGQNCSLPSGPIKRCN